MTSLGDARVIAVGSTNPVKVAAVRAVLGPMAPQARIEGVAAASGVADQPWGDDETIRGALARAHAARTALDADLGVGLEGGVVEQADGSVRTCAWAAVVDARGIESVGGSLAMPLPPSVAQLLREGMELGHAMDRMAETQGTKHGVGAVGLLTNGLVDRQRAYEHLVSYALTQWLAPDWWNG